MANSINGQQKETVFGYLADRGIGSQVLRQGRNTVSGCKSEDQFPLQQESNNPYFEDEASSSIKLT